MYRPNTKEEVLYLIHSRGAKNGKNITDFVDHVGYTMTQNNNKNTESRVKIEFPMYHQEQVPPNVGLEQQFEIEFSKELDILNQISESIENYSIQDL